MSVSDHSRLNPEGPFKVVIVDDHPITRQGMRLLLGEQPEFQVVAEAESSATAVRAFDGLEADLAIVDISLKAENGIELTKRLKAISPKTRVLVVSMHDENVYGERALRAGAMGYLMKGEAPGKLLDAVRCICAGDLYISDSMRESMLNRYVGSRSQMPSQAFAGLSDREIEILQLLGNGFTAREVAVRLNLALKTIDSHREHLKKKLNVRSSAELLRVAIEFVSNGSE
jgi:DNA-binding NarL/FixJ family response regulator